MNGFNGLFVLHNYSEQYHSQGLLMNMEVVSVPALRTGVVVSPAPTLSPLSLWVTSRAALSER